MKKSTIVTIILIAAAVVLGVIFISWYLRKATPLYIQGTVECTTYKASSKVPGRIEEMKVEEGQHVTKGELLYTLSTPELNAKLQQAEAVKSAASAMDQKALTGARIQQKEAALNLWEKAQAGLLLAQKTFDRVNNLYEQGVVPAQKLDEARANLQAMQATERAAKAQCELVFDGASKEEKEAAAAQVRQAEGAVSEVESYLSDALVYAPVTGEVSTIIAEAGELVGTGYPVVAILDMSDVWVTFNIKEDLMPDIHIGTRMTGYIPALDRSVEFEVIQGICLRRKFLTGSSRRPLHILIFQPFGFEANPAEDSFRKPIILTHLQHGIYHFPTHDPIVSRSVHQLCF